MSEPNPYAPPSAPNAPADRTALGELVHAWEKLRLLYNAILILPGIGVLLLWINRQDMPVPLAVICGILVGIGANVAFMLGPLTELYLRGLTRKGAPLGKGRLLVFGAGLVVSGGVMLAFGILAVSWEG